MTAVEDAGLREIVMERDEPAYRAPEQRSGPQAVGSADGFALGVVASTLRQRLSLPPEATRDIDLVLSRQQSADAAARFPTCADFAKALSGALTGAAGAQTAPTAAPVGSTASTPPPATTPAAARFKPSEPSTHPEPPMSVTRTSAPRAAPAPPPVPNAAQPPVPPPAPIPAPRPTPSPTSQPAPAPTLPWTPAPADPFHADTTDRPLSTPIVSASADTLDLPLSAPSPPPTDLSSWVRQIIDPPLPAPPISTEPGPGLPWDDPTWPDGDLLPQTAAPPDRPGVSNAASTTGTFAATPAIQALLRRLEQTDLLGDAVRKAAEGLPTAAGFLDRYAPDGKVGPVPLGIAAAALVAVLLLVVGQLLFATAVVMLVVVLYGVPPLVRAMTKAERGPLMAVRVTGPATLRKRQIGPGWTANDLVLGNGVTLSVVPADAVWLEAVGQPLTVERPSPVGGGTETVTLEHELPNVTATYLAMSNLLLDVRDASGAVLIRHPSYDGEPGDWLADVPRVKQAEAPSTWKRSSRGRTIDLPMPSEVRAALERERKAATTWASLVGGVPLVVVLIALFTDFGGFALVATFGVYLLLGTSALDRMLKLKAAARARRFTRVDGPVTLMQHSRGKSSPQCRLLLENGAVLMIDAATHAGLAQAGQLRTGEDKTTFWDNNTRADHLVSAHEVPSTAVMYEPTGPLLLEIVNPFGQVLYREKALGTTELGVGPPMV
jgi:hypothetical protein